MLRLAAHRSLRCSTAVPTASSVRCRSTSAEATPTEIYDATAALLEEWRQRRNSVVYGGSDLLDRVLANPRAEPLGVFANTDCYLDDIKVFGFDVDFTCVTYSQELHQLLYSTALRTLVERHSYPLGMATALQYDHTFPSRGLFFDDQHATVIKVDATQHVEVAFRGRRELSSDEINSLYPSSGHVKYTRLNEMRFLADLFCSSEVCLISDVVQYLDSAGLAFEPSHVYDDCVAAISDVHRSGVMYREITREPAKYILPNPNMYGLFKRLKAAGKQQFLLTNSPYQYVNAAMHHLCGTAEWRQLFDLIICQAGKPDFYSSSRPFRRVIPETNRVDWSPLPSSTDLLRGGEPGQVLMGGNLASLVAMTKWDR